MKYFYSYLIVYCVNIQIRNEEKFVRNIFEMFDLVLFFKSTFSKLSVNIELLNDRKLFLEINMLYLHFLASFQIKKNIYFLKK